MERGGLCCVFFLRFFFLYTLVGFFFRLKHALVRSLAAFARSGVWEGLLCFFFGFKRGFFVHPSPLLHIPDFSA